MSKKIIVGAFLTLAVSGFTYAQEQEAVTTNEPFLQKFFEIFKQKTEATKPERVSSPNRGIIKPPKQRPDGVVCTMEVKLCPDGSSVGRTGPNCEFAACPRGKSSEIISAEERLAAQQELEKLKREIDETIKALQPKIDRINVLMQKLGSPKGMMMRYQNSQVQNIKKTMIGLPYDTEKRVPPPERGDRRAIPFPPCGQDEFGLNCLPPTAQ